MSANGLKRRSTFTKTLNASTSMSLRLKPGGFRSLPVQGSRSILGRWSRCRGNRAVVMDVSQAEAMPLQRWFDIVFGLAVMGTVGTLIGIIMGGGLMPIAIAVGLVMGGVIGFLGGRRFLISILVGALLGGGLAWLVAGTERIWRSDGRISRCADLDVVGYPRGEEVFCEQGGVSGYGK